MRRSLIGIQNWSGTTQGIALIVASTFISAGLSTASKVLIVDHSAMQILFFRCLFGAIFVAVWSKSRGLSTSLISSHWLAHVIRGALNVLSLVLYVWPMAYLPLHDVVALSFTQPLFAIGLSIPVLHEKVSPKTWLAVAVGFFGMLVILRPGLAACRT